jgi:hypothetical protein
VGCGVNFGFGNTLLDFLPNAYGIDPGLLPTTRGYHSGDVPIDRVIGGYAENLPFKDKIFRTTISMKSVGWYPNVTLNPFWAVSEMIRVTEDGGLVFIHIGQKQENGSIIVDAVKQVQQGLLGKRIDSIHDYSDRPSPQVIVRLATPDLSLQ